MKKIAIAIMMLAFAGTAYAGNFADDEASRSGLKGTGAMIGNSVGGFFNSIGSTLGRLCPTKDTSK